ncbi:hypothetical protein QWE_11416 [Agrobacterium albertimagni AOL15]|uniref:DNA-directed RNA polymerase n=1 Tax=Agrobacterium albertimagni AOL15 TaxID=1156935 RepID=K2Q6W1_9HYPH|nr:hypothetical protein [Agrobacterium albertimagni]EKF59404.1 hypothetical protein QWE_11416 [Agrobacterium albertimagni AOL15]
MVIPAFSKNGEWRKDPKRHRPLGFSWRLGEQVFMALVHLLGIEPMETVFEMEVLEAILADAIMSAHLHEGRRVSYSRSRDHWVKRSRYTGRGFSRDIIVKVVDLLVRHGVLIAHDRRPVGSLGVQSSYLPNPMLAAFEMPPLSKRRGESIILKNAEGELIGYKDTADTRNKRYVLERINDVLERTKFSIAGDEELSDGRWRNIDGELLSTKQVALKRVFNGGWTLGGRFYGTFWQTMSGDARRNILIDGKATIEVDYDCLHARMIYVRAKKKLVGDPYIIEGFERKIAKRAFFVIINADGYLSAKGAVADLLEEKGLPRKLAGKLIDAMKKRHRAVEEYFHSGLGLELQNLDANMAEYVMRVMTIQKGVPCLPIHDSFIVPKDQVNNLVRTMKAAYERFVGRVSAGVCQIKSDAKSAASTSIKSDTYFSEVLHLPSSFSASLSDGKYRTPELDASILQNPEASALDLQPMPEVDVVELTAPKSPEVRVEALKGTAAVQPIRRAMPEFLRKAEEERLRVYAEQREEKHKRAEMRLRRHRTGSMPLDGSAFIQTGQTHLARRETAITEAAR